MHATLTIHAAIPLAGHNDAGLPSVCSSWMTSWNPATTGVFAIDLSVQDLTPNGFHVPVGDVFVLDTGPESGAVVGGGMGDVQIDPFFCDSAATPAGTVDADVYVNNFVSPNHPGGDFGILANTMDLKVESWLQSDDGLGAFGIALPIASCSATGIVRTSHYKNVLAGADNSSVVTDDECRLSFT